MRLKRKNRYRQGLTAIVFLLGVLFSLPYAAAQVPTSSNYSIGESSFSSGSFLDSSSSQYQAKATVGETVIGNVTGSDYQLYGGFTTTDQPYLEFYFNTTLIDFGLFDENSTSSGTATMSVRSYLADGYSVHINGDTLTNENGDQIAAMASATSSVTGDEQFGLNLVANTIPVVGADPVQQPDASFGFGDAAAGYDTPNVFKFVPGEAVAYSPASSGQTDYTISYIVNVSPITPAGVYEAEHSYVVVASF